MITPALTWRKSSYSGNTGGECVEVAVEGAHVFIRDSKYRRTASNDLTTEPIIRVTLAQWNALVRAVLGNTAEATEPAIQLDREGSATFRAADGTALVFTAGEWDAFVAGARAGEFDQVLLPA